MKYSQKLSFVKTFVVDNFVDVSDLVNWLGITIEEVIESHPDKLVHKYEEIKSPEEAFEEDVRSREFWEDEEEGGY